MSNEPTQQANRLDRRKARTRAALSVLRRRLSPRDDNVPILKITQAADVGMGSFYNHFETKEQLFEAAVEAVMDGYGQLLDDLTAGIGIPQWCSPAASGYRTAPTQGTGAQPGLPQQRAPAAQRRQRPGTTCPARHRGRRGAGRFDVEDVDVAVTMTAGALIALGQLLHDQPERDVEETTDRVTEDLLRMFGVTAAAARRICRLPLPDLAAATAS